MCHMKKMKQEKVSTFCHLSTVKKIIVGKNKLTWTVDTENLVKFYTCCDYWYDSI